MRSGYGRVFTRDKNFDAQRDDPAAAGCDRQFAHRTRNYSLRQHNDTSGYRCRGRSGRYAGTRY